MMIILPDARETGKSSFTFATAQNSGHRTGEARFGRAAALGRFGGKSQRPRRAPLWIARRHVQRPARNTERSILGKDKQTGQRRRYSCSIFVGLIWS